MRRDAPQRLVYTNDARVHIGFGLRDGIFGGDSARLQQRHYNLRSRHGRAAQYVTVTVMVSPPAAMLSSMLGHMMPEALDKLKAQAPKASHWTARGTGLR